MIMNASPVIKYEEKNCVEAAEFVQSKIIDFDELSVSWEDFFSDTLRDALWIFYGWQPVPNAPL